MKILLKNKFYIFILHFLFFAISSVFAFLPLFRLDFSYFLYTHRTIIVTSENSRVGGGGAIYFFKHGVYLVLSKRSLGRYVVTVRNDR
jgi:hypothetical protein